MKNKTKKILATACLGLVGMGAMTGCAMSDDQKAALDLISGKADKLVELLESNMEYNNTKLSKAEAAEKILLGRNRFILSDFDKFQMSMIQNQYEGVFDSIELTYTDDETTPYGWLYKKDGDVKTKAVLNGDDIHYMVISDFEEDKHTIWEDGQNSFLDREYESDDFSMDSFSGFLEEFVGPVITEDDIKDIKVTDSGYEFTVVNIIEDSGTMTCESRLFVTFDNYITKWVLKGVTEDQTDYTSYYVEFNFKYNDDVDVKPLDDKIASLTQTQN